MNAATQPTTTVLLDLAPPGADADTIDRRRRAGSGRCWGVAASMLANTAHMRHWV